MHKCDSMRIGSGQLLRISLKLIVFIVLLTGGMIVVVPSALGDSSGDPFSALWDAVYDLKERDDNLQSQIDAIRTTPTAQPESESETPKSDPALDTMIENGDVPGEILVSMEVTNNGPDRAAGVRLTAFYKMSLFHVESIANQNCVDLGRGIVQCDLGTIESGNESAVSIVASPLSDGDATLIVDLTSTTEDLDPTNNRNVIEFTVNNGGIQEKESGNITDNDPDESPDTGGSNDESDSNEAQEGNSDQEENADQDATPNSNQTSSSSDTGSNATDTSTSESQSSSEASNQDSSSSNSNSTSSEPSSSSDESDSSSGNESSSSSGDTGSNEENEDEQEPADDPQNSSGSNQTSSG